MRLLVEMFLDADRRAVAVRIGSVSVREVPSRGALLLTVPRSATTAVIRSASWMTQSLNECEQTPFTCAKQSTGRPTRWPCPACGIRKALGMPPLKRVRR